MQIHVSKSGRKVKLTKRERDLLDNTKALLAELAASGGGDIATASEDAVDAIHAAQAALDGLPLLAGATT